MKIIYWSIAMIAATTIAAQTAQADVSLSIAIAPPELPIYAQPAMPGDGYMWTPGYWSWNAQDNDYFWVPGTWVATPFIGALWTPGYWGWSDAGYNWHGGYWGSHVGYYGGINYGFGYVGVGYRGGYWNNGAFSYNRNVNNTGNARIAHTYNDRIENTAPARVSYNGGAGGVRLQPTHAEVAIANMPHNAQTAPQLQHEQSSRANQDLRASVNHGVPKIAATPEPGAFGASGVIAARQPQFQNRQPGSIASAPQPRQQAYRAPVAMAPEQRVRADEHGAQHASPERGNPPHQPGRQEEEHREK
jgi:hypothetical protein